MCISSLPDCISEISVSIFPGERFEIKAAAVGQQYGIVPSIMTAQLLLAMVALGKGTMYKVWEDNVPR